MKSAGVTRGWLAEPKPRGGKGWPPARRAAQAARCRAARPWRHATGPRTAASKARCRYNGLRHAMRSAAYARLRRLLKAQRRFVETCDARFGAGRAAGKSPLDKSGKTLAASGKALYIRRDSAIKSRVAAVWLA